MAPTSRLPQCQSHHTMRVSLIACSAFIAGLIVAVDATSCSTYVSDVSSYGLDTCDDSYNLPYPMGETHLSAHLCLHTLFSVPFV